MLRISIITPTLNSENTLADTLRSVAAQQFPAYEHLIIDGGSTDATLQIAAGFPHRTKIMSEPDLGLYHAVNKGIRLATGEVIGILNSDDFYTHDRVLFQVANRMCATGAEALYADLEYVHPTRPDKVVRYWKSGCCKSEKFRLGWMPPHPTLFIRKSVYEQFGVYNPELRISADYELMLRFLFREKISVCYLPEVIARMRTGGLSNARWRNRWRANREDRRAWRLNGLKPPFYTLFFKPMLKIRQFRL
jgi:glycosyltransferase